MSESFDIHDEILVIAINNPPVNSLSDAIRKFLISAIVRLTDDVNLKGAVIIGRQTMFSAGADIKEFGKSRVLPQLPDILAQIEALEKPVVAAISGKALGGGLELALACHYRVASQSAIFGLPEVKLGLLPGAGGTQRLSRLTSIEFAAEMCALGGSVDVAVACRAGLVDKVTSDADLLESAVAFARSKIGLEMCRARDRQTVGDVSFLQDFSSKHARKFRGFDAPAAVLRCLKAATELSFDEAMKIEREEFTTLLNGPQSGAQRHLFTAERRAAAIDGISLNIQMRDIARVGIVGAGTMGGGIAMNFLQAGIPVTLIDANQKALDRGVGILRSNYESSLKTGRLCRDQVDHYMDLLDPRIGVDFLSDCDLIIEAVYEDIHVKKDIFSDIARVAKRGAILASNTSYLDIDTIAASAGRERDFVGLHFFSPANVMRLLEIVRGAETSDDVLATMMALAKTIGKVGVLSGSCEGFIANRMLRRRQSEAMNLLMEGVSPHQIDAAHTNLGMPMGPFQMNDLAGVDIGWHRDPNRIESVRDALCARGRFGQKVGKGFYDYDAKRRPIPSAEVQTILGEFAERAGRPPRNVGDREIIERTLYPAVNEGVLILEEGIAQRASDIDLVWVHGFGWPAYLGGLMYWARDIGAAEIADALQSHGLPISNTLSRRTFDISAFTTA